MLCQFPADCLNEIFEILEKDKVTLHSCLLVNRLWCKVSVRILWRNIWEYTRLTRVSRWNVSKQVIRTLINSLPNESKGLLRKNGVLTSILTSKPSLFNYASFCKTLSIHEILNFIEIFFLECQNSFTLENLDLVAQEILKMFMNQITLTRLTYHCYNEISKNMNMTFIHLPGAKDCLKHLSELNCSSDVHSEFFNRLSQICHNIQSLNINFVNTVSNGLKDLISSQNGLKYLSLTKDTAGADLTDIIPSLTKHSNTLIKVYIIEMAVLTFSFDTPLTFMAKFVNLQELSLSLNNRDTFKVLQHTTFPKLQILKFKHGCPDTETLIKFLEVNGKNLKGFHIHKCDDALNLAIAKLCPNLKSLFTLFNEIETLKGIFNSCQQLESMEVWCDRIYLKEKETLTIVAKHSPVNFHELYIGNARSELVPKDLESFFISWKNRVSQKSFSFIITNGRNNLAGNDENMKIIEKYKKLGIIKKFDIVER